MSKEASQNMLLQGSSPLELRTNYPTTLPEDWHKKQTETFWWKI